MKNVKDVTINGIKTRVFVLKEGEAADIVIPFTSLTYVNYKRMKSMAQQRGELMEVMSKTTLSNGKNALKQFENLIVALEHNQTMGEIKTSNTQNEVTGSDNQKDDPQVTEDQANADTDENPADEKPKKRGPGRPKTKKTTEE